MSRTDDDAMSGDPAINAAAGAAAGSAVLFALFPIDLSKTYMQANGATVGQTVRALVVNSDSPVRRLYRGVLPAVTEQMLNRSMLFGIGSLIKSVVPEQWPEPARDAASGAGAALIKTSVLHPLDSVKCRWQLGLPLSELGGLYHGISPAIIRSSFGMAVWLTSRNALERNLPDQIDGPPRHFLAGAMSSLLTDLLTFPFDTLKKAMQATGASDKRAGLLSEMARLREEAGLVRFYRGYSARVVMISMNGALFNAAFVAIKGSLSAVSSMR